MYTIELIPTNVTSASLVAFSDKLKFPRGKGNYISVGAEGGNECFQVVNVSEEDLEDAKKIGLISDTMNAAVYRTNDGQQIAFIIDSRLPVKARSCRHWYNGAHKVAVAIIREEYDIPEGTCICEDELSEVDALAIVSSYKDDVSGKWVRMGRCRECSKMYTIVKLNNYEI